MGRVRITNGPKNWQIIQQENGLGQIDLEGDIVLEETDIRDNLRVVIHIYYENDRTEAIAPIYIFPQGKIWSASFQVPVGGMYTIATFLRYGERDVYRGDAIFHVGVGDVYLIAGQSNAFGTSKDSIEDSLSPFVHVFRLNGTWDMAAHPLHDATGALFPELYDEASFHSPWIAFARQIYKKTGYPIGLIPTAKGGTPLSYWDKAEDGRLLQVAVELVKLSGTKVCGVLWYQGCNDAVSKSLSQAYLDRFENVYQDFRKEFGEDLIFLTVQLNKSTYNLTREKALGYATVREAQRQAAKRNQNVYVVPAIDLSVCDTIHNSAHSNLVIARRVANIALKYKYGQAVICDFPNIQMAKKVNNDTVRLFFDNVVDALTADYVDAVNFPFQIIDERGKADLAAIQYNADNSLDLTFERKIGKNACIGCTKESYLGALPYDVATRLPILAFSNIRIGD